jgi:hypothetical protein
MSKGSNLRSGRIVGPVSYVNETGKPARIPRGPCLLEQTTDDQVDVIWGEAGQRSAVLSKVELEAATASGGLVLLDTAG